MINAIKNYTISLKNDFIILHFYFTQGDYRFIRSLNL